MLERIGNAVADKNALRVRSTGKTPLLEEGLGQQRVRAVYKQGNASDLQSALCAHCNKLALRRRRFACAFF